MADEPVKQSIWKRFWAWRAVARANPYFLTALAGAVVVMLLDQCSKVWIVKIVRLPERRHIEISSIFDLTYVQNYGASFGLGAGGMSSRIILSVMVIGIIAFLVYWLAGVRRKLTVAGIAIILGGALGNLFDRVLYGYVIDFLDFSGLWFPWVFNVADTAINIGLGCVLLDMVLDRETPDKV